MGNKKFSPFVVYKPNGLHPRPKVEARPKPKPLHTAKLKLKTSRKLEAKGLFLENKKKLDIVYGKCLFKATREEFIYRARGRARATI